MRVGVIDDFISGIGCQGPDRPVKTIQIQSRGWRMVSPALAIALLLPACNVPPLRLMPPAVEPNVFVPESVSTLLLFLFSVPEAAGNVVRQREVVGAIDI